MSVRTCVEKSCPEGHTATETNTEQVNGHHETDSQDCFLLQDKLMRVADGEQRWGLFKAVKPSSG